jgi:hypothetical protein
VSLPCSLGSWSLLLCCQNEKEIEQQIGISSLFPIEVQIDQADTIFLLLSAMHGFASSIVFISHLYVYDSETHHLYSIDIHFHANYIYNNVCWNQMRITATINILQVMVGRSVMFLSSLPTVHGSFIYTHT